jgi:CheY-like chemotaxis protein
MINKSANLKGSHYGEKVFDLGDVELANTVRRILLLDDDVDFRELLKEFLAPQCFEITCVSNGAEGLRRIMANEFDVILCDMMMPSLPGDMFYMAVERVKPLLCKRFVFMTGHKGDPKYDIFIRRIKGLVLWKPFQIQDLQSAIDHIITQNKAASKH